MSARDELTLKVFDALSQAIHNIYVARDSLDVASDNLRLAAYEDVAENASDIARHLFDVCEKVIHLRSLVHG